VAGHCPPIKDTSGQEEANSNKCRLELHGFSFVRLR
jgi:hypothetical protein